MKAVRRSTLLVVAAFGVSGVHVPSQNEAEASLDADEAEVYENHEDIDADIDEASLAENEEDEENIVEDEEVDEKEVAEDEEEEEQVAEDEEEGEQDEEDEEQEEAEHESGDESMEAEAAEDYDPDGFDQPVGFMEVEEESESFTDVDATSDANAIDAFADAAVAAVDSDNQKRQFGERIEEQLSSLKQDAGVPPLPAIRVGDTGVGLTAKATSGVFDCQDGFLNWKRGWSGTKMRWCCINKAKGCPETAEDMKRRAAAAVELKAALLKEEDAKAMMKQIKKGVLALRSKENQIQKKEETAQKKVASVSEKEGKLEQQVEKDALAKKDRDDAIAKVKKKERMVKMREYDVKMKEQDTANRTKALSRRATQIAEQQKSLVAEQESSQKSEGKVKAAELKLQKDEGATKAKIKQQDALIKSKIAAFKAKKEAVLKKRAAVDERMAKTKQRQRQLTVLANQVSMSEQTNDEMEKQYKKDTEAANDKIEEQEAVLKIQGQAIDQKAEEAKAALKAVSEKEQKVAEKQKHVKKLEAELVTLQKHLAMALAPPAAKKPAA